MNNPSSSPDVLERVFRELLGEEEERGMEERLAIVFKTGSLRGFSGSTFQQDFTDFVRTIYDGEERGAYEFWRRRSRNRLNALSLAARLGLTRLCQALIQSFGYNVDGTGALHLATLENRIFTVRALIDLGANVNEIGRNQYTPLHVAVLRGYEELVQLLISRGANTETSCIFGTPLQCAAVAAQQGTMQILLDNNVNMNSVSDSCSLTPLHLAVREESMECLRQLLRGAAARTIACGTTPLCDAASHNTSEMIPYLLTGGADPNAVDMFNSTPLENAILARRPTSALMLLRVTTTFATWNLSEVTAYINSSEYQIQRNNRREQVFRITKALGDEASRNDRDFNAVQWYTVAIHANPSDPTVYSYRSMSYACLFLGEAALDDAQQCLRMTKFLVRTSRDAQQRVRLKKLLAEAHYREAEAWYLLKDEENALQALFIASTSAPYDSDLQTAIQSLLEEIFEDRRG